MNKRFTAVSTVGEHWAYRDAKTLALTTMKLFNSKKIQYTNTKTSDETIAAITSATI